MWPLSHAGALVHESVRARTEPFGGPIYSPPIACDSGLPSSDIRFNTRHPSLASLNACGREGTEWGSWDQSVHAGTLFARRSRRSFRACSSLRSRSDQIWVALPSMKSSGAM